MKAKTKYIFLPYSRAKDEFTILESKSPSSNVTVIYSTQKTPGYTAGMKWVYTAKYLVDWHGATVYDTLHELMKCFRLEMKRK